MGQVVEELNANDHKFLALHRNWLDHQSAGSDIESTSEAKLHLIQTIIEGEELKKYESTKIQSLGVGFGDALTQDVPELEWVAVEDEDGRELALRFKHTSILFYPLTDLARRIEDYVEVDVMNMFDGFKGSIYDILEDIA
ncbi:MAG: DUF3806 domain-containing protein [Cellvibrionaceae bacterium]